MKKLMKAIAFATVMCMLLSTAAFASEATRVAGAEKTLNITITGVGNGEQVSLLVVAPETTTPDENNIYYVGQDVAASGQVVFENINLTNVDGDTVEIWSGNATYAANNALAPIQKLTSVKIVEEVTDVVLQVVTPASVVADKVQTEAKDYYATALKMTVNFTAIPAGYSASKMIWAIQTSEDRKYTPVIDAAWLAAIETNTDIAFGVAFDNGSVKQGITPLTVTGGDMIFKFVKAGEADKEAFTNPTVDNKDAARK